MDPQNLLVVLLFVIGAGGVLFALIIPNLTGEAKGEKRFEEIAGAGADKKNAVSKTALLKHKKDIEADLKELESKGQNKAPSLRLKLSRAGLDTWDAGKYHLVSMIMAGGVGVLAFALSGNLLIGLVGVPVGYFGVPKWYVARRAKKRQKDFINKFPDAVDMMVRGLRSGLPLTDTIRIVANEASSPVKEEFVRLIETQSIGLTIAEAVERIAHSIPTTETSFFANVIQIQQKSGGNLSEALGNLSRVLRDRKKMREKIIAISSEATASAMIIGALPFIVAGLVYFTSPQYISMLWTEPTGRFILVVCAFWMSLGVFVMKKMINFDF